MLDAGVFLAARARLIWKVEDEDHAGGCVGMTEQELRGDRAINLR